MGRPKKLNRQGVLERVLPVFWRRGFADASLHELEVATGVNKSGFYSEFKDKEDLFVQSLESLEEKGLLTTEPLGWNNIERFLKMGPCTIKGKKDVLLSAPCGVCDIAAGSCCRHNIRGLSAGASNDVDY
jgi:hypothetical protein